MIVNVGVVDGNWLGNFLEEIGILLLLIVFELIFFFLEVGEIVNVIFFLSIVGDEFCLFDGLLVWYVMIGLINNINLMGIGIIGVEKNLGILFELGSVVVVVVFLLVDIVLVFFVLLISMVKLLLDGVLCGLGEVLVVMCGVGIIG